jgi:hypothetical protein
MNDDNDKTRSFVALVKDTAVSHYSAYVRNVRKDFRTQNVG